MSNDVITLDANKRDVMGKQVRALRAEGYSPAVVHDHGKASIHVTILEKDLKKVLHQAGKHHPVQLNIDGKKYSTMIKEVTYRPATNFVYHGVFQAISATETVKTSIPIHLIGEVPAEKASLLVLQSIDSVEVEALSKDLVDAIEVDATSLVEAGDKILVSDIKAPNGMIIMTDPELAIATVEVPKDQIADADAAVAEMAAADAAGESAGEATTEAEAAASEGTSEGSKTDSDS
jgi:large subunit ribosomal protein L25